MCKAFDFIMHQMLNKMVDGCWVATSFCSTLLPWFGEHLSGRTQYVNGLHSREYLVKIGVPQDSNLGALLPIIFFHPIPALGTSNILMFAHENELFVELSKF